MNKVSFIILSYNNLEMTKDCIESIRANCKDINYELILIDNGSTDVSALWLSKQKDIKLISNDTNVGFPAGCNQGIMASDEKSDIFLLNNDTLVPPHSIKNLLEALYSSEKVGAVGPLSNNCPNYQSVDVAGITPQNYEDIALKYTSDKDNIYEKRSWLVGFALLIKREVLNRVGLLDEIFTPGNFEDNDICWRILEKGYDILLCRNSFIFHYGSASFNKNPHNYNTLLNINETKFQNKWGVHPSRYTYIKKELLTFLPSDKHIKILEIGCGMGSTITRIKHDNEKAECYGVEINEKAAKIAGRLHENIVCADIEKNDLPQSYNDFDYILVGSVIEYLKEPEKTIKYLWSLLKEGGILVGSVHNADCHKKYDEGGQKLYNLKELNSLMDDAHIEIGELSYIPSIPDKPKSISNMKQFVFCSKPKEIYPLSVCIITKNESHHLERCLNSLAKYPLEVVIADTGSTDDTFDMIKRILSSYPKCNIIVEHFKWINDFAAAKNYAISIAHNDLVMVIDSDEWITSENLKQVINTMNDSLVGQIKRINIYERDGELFENHEWIGRIFNKKFYHYEGRIHEQLVNINNIDAEIKRVKTEVTICHDGYAGTKEDVTNKALRNISLINACILDEGENPYMLYQLGKSYYMIGDYEKSAQCFDKALSYDLNPKLEYVIDMVETYGYSLINSNQSKKALMLENVYDEFGDSADFKFMMGLIYMNNERFDDAVNEFLSATQYKESRMKGTNSFLAYYNAGVIMDCLGYKEEALILYKKCDGYKKAMDRIKEIQEPK